MYCVKGLSARWKSLREKFVYGGSSNPFVSLPPPPHFFFRHTPMRFTSRATLLQTSRRRKRNATRCRGGRFVVFFRALLFVAARPAQHYTFPHPDPGFFFFYLPVYLRPDVVIYLYEYMDFFFLSVPFVPLRAFLYVSVCVCV